MKLFHGNVGRGLTLRSQRTSWSMESSVGWTKDHSLPPTSLRRVGSLRGRSWDMKGNLAQKSAWWWCMSDDRPLQTARQVSRCSPRIDQAFPFPACHNSQIYAWCRAAVAMPMCSQSVPRLGIFILFCHGLCKGERFDSMSVNPSKNARSKAIQAFPLQGFKHRQNIYQKFSSLSLSLFFKQSATLLINPSFLPFHTQNSGQKITLFSRLNEQFAINYWSLLRAALA